MRELEIIQSLAVEEAMKSKIIFLLTLFFIITSTYGQNVKSFKGYRYVYVPTSLYYEGKRADIWGITAHLREFFSVRGFTVLTEQSGVVQEVVYDPCLVLWCTMEHTAKDRGGNSVTITLRNCKNEVVYTGTGSAKRMGYQSEFTAATKEVITKMASVRCQFDPSFTPVMENPEVEKTNETEESIKAYLSANALDPIEGIYNSRQDSNLAYYKIGIVNRGDRFKAIILESPFKAWRPGEVKAVFEPTSMQGYFAAKWFMRNKSRVDTYATMENPGLLAIEIGTDSKGAKTQDYFVKMFPPVSGGTMPRAKALAGSGSGVFISKEGIIATNAHVVDDATDIQISFVNELGSFTHKAKILLVDNKNDVALIKIDDEKFKGLSSIPYGFAERSSSGEKVFTSGFPLNDIMGTNYKVTDGIISAQSGIADDVRYLQITVPLQPGNSGGPLFNKDGNVIGLTTLKLNSKAIGTDVENVNFAIKASYLITLFNMLPNAEKVNANSKLAAKEMQDQIKVLKNYVCLIRTF